MASDLWKLEISGVLKTLTAWGVRNGVLTRRSLEADEFVFTIPVTDIFASPGIAYGNSIRVLRGTEWVFSGSVLHVSSSFGAEERVGVTAVNNWHNLERIIYQQKYVYRSGTGYATLNMGWSTRVTLGQDEWGQKIRTDEQITKIMLYAAGFGSGINISSGLSSFVTPPLSEARDISCAAAIMRMVEYTPDAASWCSYAGGGAGIVIRRWSGLPTITLDLADKNLIASVESLRPRSDMNARGVVFTFITGVRDPFTDELIPQEVRQTAGVTVGPGVVCATIELANQGEDNAEVVPDGLAAEYFSSLTHTHWEGSITLLEDECTGLIHPGHRLNLANGRAEWATMNAMVTSVTEDLDAGSTSIECGLPAYLGAGDFLDLMTRWRNRKPVSDFPKTQTNGTAGVPTENGGDGAAPGVSTPAGNSSAGQFHGGGGMSFPMEVCEDGVTKVRIVQGG